MPWWRRVCNVGSNLPWIYFTRHWILVALLGTVPVKGAEDLHLSNQTFSWLEGMRYCDNKNMQMLNDSNSPSGRQLTQSVWISELRIQVQAMEKDMLIRGTDVATWNRQQCLCTNSYQNKTFTSDEGTGCRIENDCHALKMTKATDVWDTIGQPSVDLLNVGSIDFTAVMNSVSNGENITVTCFEVNPYGTVSQIDCSEKRTVACINSTLKDYISFRNRPTAPVVTTESSTRSGTNDLTTQEPSISPSQSTGSTSSFLGNTTTQSHSRPPVEEPVMTELVYAAVGGSIALFVVIVCVVICCCCSRSKKNERSMDVRLADVYSDAADSIAMKETDRATPAEKVEYAIPEDALPERHALPRNSIGENEYDSTISKKPSAQATGNIYSHVTIQCGKSSLASSRAAPEAEYDVTSYSNSQTSNEAAQQC